MQIIQSRRDFVASLSAAATAGILGTNGSLADDGPPETTTIRLPLEPGVCSAPEQLADALLRAEGFTDIRYVQVSHRGEAVLRGEINFASETPAWLVSYLDAGNSITVLAGLHVGCWELFAHEPVRTISDLKGKRVGIPEETGSSMRLVLALMAAHVGLDPHVDLHWITIPSGDFMDAFAQGKVDAFLAFAPEPQELRARKLGQVILNTTLDKPWSQYFCCTEFGSRDFVRAHPIATKRYLRAILKLADICAAEPTRVAQELVDGGFTERYDYALQALTEIPYDRWREYDPEDALRFFALRLHEVGMIESSPNRLIAEGTDWRFLNDLKRELKA
jgi:NitT/TauT family transport system substrate-binding protein